MTPWRPPGVIPKLTALVGSCPLYRGCRPVDLPGRQTRLKAWRLRRAAPRVRKLRLSDVRMTVFVAFRGPFSLANSPESLYSASARLAGYRKTALTIRRTTRHKEP
jgi:hypothetical protein